MPRKISEDQTSKQMKVPQLEKKEEFVGVVVRGESTRQVVGLSEPLLSQVFEQEHMMRK